MHPTLAADLCQLNFAEGAEGTGNQDILNLWTGKNVNFATPIVMPVLLMMCDALFSAQLPT
eukprot:scaffold71632_cov25-Tisochrysis_lutea.AAC.1